MQATSHGWQPGIGWVPREDPLRQPHVRPDALRCPTGIYAACPRCKRLAPTYNDRDGNLTFNAHTLASGEAPQCPNTDEPVPADAYRAQTADTLPSSVLPQETAVDDGDAPNPIGRIEPATPVETAFRHSGWRRQRSRVLQALRNTKQPTSRREAFKQCGSDAWVYVHETNKDEFKVASGRCKDRFCQPCQTDRSFLIRNNLRAVLADRRRQHARTRQVNFRHIVLTVLTLPDDDLADTLDSLYAWFRRLRQTPLWRLTQRGGAAMCELKWMHETRRWHPHLHIISEGGWLEKQALKREWLRITGRSHIVSVDAIYEDEKAIREVTNYASKPLSDTFASDVGLLGEAVVALRGRKLIHCYGSWHKFKLLAAPTEEVWLRLGRLSAFLHRAKMGDAAAAEVLAHLSKKPNNEPRAASLAMERAPPPEQMLITWTEDARHANGCPDPIAIPTPF